MDQNMYEQQILVINDSLKVLLMIVSCQGQNLFQFK